MCFQIERGVCAQFTCVAQQRYLHELFKSLFKFRLNICDLMVAHRLQVYGVKSQSCRAQDESSTIEATFAFSAKV